MQVIKLMSTKMHFTRNDSINYNFLTLSIHSPHFLNPKSNRKSLTSNCGTTTWLLASYHIELIYFVNSIYICMWLEINNIIAFCLYAARIFILSRIMMICCAHSRHFAYYMFVMAPIYLNSWPVDITDERSFYYFRVKCAGKMWWEQRITQEVYTYNEMLLRTQRRLLHVANG